MATRMMRMGMMSTAHEQRLVLQSPEIQVSFWARSGDPTSRFGSLCSDKVADGNHANKHASSIACIVGGPWVLQQLRVSRACLTRKRLSLSEIPASCCLSYHQHEG